MQKSNPDNKSKSPHNAAIFLNLVEKGTDAIVILDDRKKVMYVNPAAIQLLNLKKDEVVGHQLPIDLDGLFENPDAVTDLTIPQPNSQLMSVTATFFKSEWDEQPCDVLSFHKLETLNEHQKTIAHLSTHDYTTDLPNRDFFEKTLKKAKKESKDIALLYVDLDNFKIINDALGRRNGDLLLKKVSDTVQKLIRKEDTLARMGGDEFAIVIIAPRKIQYLDTIAQKIIEAICSITTLDESEIYISASIGIAYSSSAEEDINVLIRNADLAMYFAKQQGKNQYCFFSEDLAQKNERMLEISKGLRDALKNNEFYLEYQPIMDLTTDKCSGFETLLRWEHPTLGVIHPAEILAVAEETGRMPGINKWLIQQSLTDYGLIRNDSLLFLTINISKNTLNFFNLLEKILEIDAKNVVLEINETYLMRSPEEFIAQFNRFLGRNIQIAIDDYGTGFSSLNYLKRLPISILKLDKSLIDDIAMNPTNDIILASTIQLAHDLGLKVVAEGVESKKQLDFLKKNKCDFAQGYYFSHPLPVNKLKDYLK